MQGRKTAFCLLRSPYKTGINTLFSFKMQHHCQVIEEHLRYCFKRWSPLIKFKEPSPDSGSIISTAEFSIIDIKDKAIVKFEIMIDDRWKKWSIRPLLLPWFCAIEQVVIKKDPIPNYAALYEVLEGNHRTYLECQEEALKKNGWASTVIESGVTLSDSELNLKCLAELVQKEGRTETTKVLDSSKTASRPLDSCSSDDSKMNTYVYLYRSQKLREGEGKSKLSDIFGGISYSHPSVEIVTRGEKSWANISSEPFPNSEGNFSVTTSKPRVVLTFSGKPLGINDSGTTEIFPFSAEQRQYWERIQQTKAAADPPLSSIPINWYHISGQIKNEYKSRWDNLKAADDAGLVLLLKHVSE